MRKIREEQRPFHDIQPKTQHNIQPTMQPKIQPDNRATVVAAHVTTTPGVTIKGILWGNGEIDARERLEGLFLEMRNLGSNTFSLQDAISCEGTNAGQTLSGIIQRINARRHSMTFKIGITWNPPWRWLNPKYGYEHDGFSHMEILAWDYRGSIIGLMEAALINHFQTVAPRLCLNRKLGDDNRQEISPQFL